MKTVLITGVSRGIGRALADKFSSEGWHVFGTSQTGMVENSNDNIEIFELDLTSADSIKRFHDALKKQGKRIDIFINNAGALFDEDETRVVVEKLRQTLEVNLIGTVDLTEQMIDMLSKESHIVNISSSAGSLNGASDLTGSHYPYHYPAYKISKAALNMYTRTLANRLSNEGSSIIVSSVHPGWVKTDMGGDDAPVMPEEAAANIYKLAISRPPTGRFWFKDEQHPW